MASHIGLHRVDAGARPTAPRVASWPSASILLAAPWPRELGLGNCDTSVLARTRPPMFATLDLKFAHLDGFHVSGLVSAIRIVSATTRDDVSRSNRTRCELRGSRLSGLHSIARTSAFRGPKIR